MADISTTCTITVALATQAAWLSRRLGVRESVPVSVVDSNGLNWPAGTYHLVLTHGTTPLADATLTGAGTATLSGTLDLAAGKALEAFPQHAPRSLSSPLPYDTLRCVLTLYNSTALTVYCATAVNLYWSEDVDG